MSGQNKYRILVVEDEPINRKVLEYMLDNIECEYDTATNGTEAVKLALNNRYDIIFMDIQLPDISGITVTKQLRSTGITTPIIATTAHALPDERVSFIAAGLSDVLAKPFRQQQIAEIIDKWLKETDPA
ncbi:MAG: response regulator [Pseudomonadota bacterium]|nr:response regulator [Pseudomonadota bacterium]